MIESMNGAEDTDLPHRFQIIDGVSPPSRRGGRLPTPGLSHGENIQHIPTEGQSARYLVTVVKVTNGKENPRTVTQGPQWTC